MIEIAIIGSDMQEVIGTAIALYLLSNKLYVLSWTHSPYVEIHTLEFALTINMECFAIEFRCGLER